MAGKLKNNELFLGLYNKLDGLLRDYYGVADYGVSVIVRRINELRDSPLNKKKERAEKLEIIRNLRISLVHVEMYDNTENFCITRKIIDALEREIDDVIRPMKAFDVCKRMCNLVTASLETNIHELTYKMIEGGFTHIPVLQRGVLVGVFSENTFFTRFHRRKKLGITDNATIKDYSEYIKLNIHQTQYFDFVSKCEKVDKLIPMFSKKRNGKKLAMLFVTATGNSNEPIMGIITMYDIIHNQTKRSILPN